MNLGHRLTLSTRLVITWSDGLGLFHDMMFGWLVGLGLDIRLGKRVLVGWLVGW